MTIFKTTKQALLITASAGLAVSVSLSVHAGALENGSWVPRGCGARPEAPVIESTSPEAYNRSIGLVNAWQKQLQGYNDCLIKEANADAAAINQSANAEQMQINEVLQKVNADATAARSKLDSSPSAPAAPQMMQNPNTQMMQNPNY
ncbi:MAG TPA: hypothetical protein VHB01_03270 [Nitrosospira sp.]|nr:hypothetical protein [Nitrosospira sp.]